MIVSFRSPLTADAVEFLSRETGVEFGQQDMRHWFCATAWSETGQVIGALACEPKTWFDWHWSCAVADQRVLSRRLLRAIFRALFSRAVRVTALVEPDNDKALKGVKQLGFVYEGFLRMGIEGRRDALVFGMLEGDCRWLATVPQRGSTIVRTDIGASNGLLS